MEETLKEVRDDSLEFNKRVFGDNCKRKIRVENIIEVLQRRLESVNSVAFLIQLQQAKEELDIILGQTEMLWFQKSREK